MNFFTQLCSGRIHPLLLVFILMMCCQINHAIYYSGRKSSFPRLGKRNEPGPQTEEPSQSGSNEERPDSKILQRLYEIIDKDDPEMEAEIFPRASSCHSK